MKNSRYLVGGVVVIIALTAIIMFKSQKPPMEPPAQITINFDNFKHGEDIFISPKVVHDQLSSPKMVIIDGNNPKLYAKGHLPGAINIGYKGLSLSVGKPGDENWGTILPQDALTQKLESFGVTSDTLIVAYSDTFKGPGSGGRAVWQLKMAGFDNIRLMYGGLEVWRQLQFPITKDIPVPTPASGLSLKTYDESYRADRHFVEANLGKMKLVDVRSKNEFTGKDTSRGESRGGHIKDAEWLEWTALLNENSTPKSPEEIIALMASVDIHPDDDFILY